MKGILNQPIYVSEYDEEVVEPQARVGITYHQQV